MRQAEPPSSSRSSLFLIGQNSRGNWVVQDQRGLCGGIFVDRAKALRFAMFENGNRPQAVVLVPGVFELDMGRKPCTARQTVQSYKSDKKRVCEKVRGYAIPWDAGAIAVVARVSAQGHQGTTRWEERHAPRGWKLRATQFPSAARCLGSRCRLQPV
jgi:hypothetical protein